MLKWRNIGFDSESYSWVIIRSNNLGRTLNWQCLCSSRPDVCFHLCALEWRILCSNAERSKMFEITTRNSSERNLEVIESISHRMVIEIVAGKSTFHVILEKFVFLIFIIFNYFIEPRRGKCFEGTNVWSERMQKQLGFILYWTRMLDLHIRSGKIKCNVWELRFKQYNIHFIKIILYIFFVMEGRTNCWVIRILRITKRWTAFYNYVW